MSDKLAEELYWAVYCCTKDEVKALVAKGADPDHELFWTEQENIKVWWPVQSPPVHIACLNGTLDVLTTLAEAGAKLDVKDRTGQTPMDMAQSNLYKWEGCVDVAVYLVDCCGASDNEVAEIMCGACFWGKLDTVKNLIQKHQLNLNDVRDGRKKTSPIHLACAEGHINIIQYLVKELNCDVDLRCSNNQTPIYCACSEGQKESVLYLIDELHCKIDVRDNDDKSPLDVALDNRYERCGCLDIALHLMHQLGSTDEVLSRLLCGACRWGRLDIVKELVEQHNVVPSDVTDQGKTPLYWAIMRGSTDVIDYLNCLPIDHLPSSSQGGPSDDYEELDLDQFLKLATQTFSAPNKSEIAINVLATLGTKYEFLFHPMSTSCKPGSIVSISVVLTEAPLTYQWYFREKPIFTTNTEYKGVKTDTLVVNKCLPKHKGPYKCVVTVEFGEELCSDSAVLSIDGEIIEVNESKLLSKILKKSDVNLEVYGIDVNQLAEGESGLTYEEVQYALKDSPSVHNVLLCEDLKEDLKSRLQEEQLYEEAMINDHKVSLSYTKILALGPGQVGKSTFLYRLMGLMKGNIKTADPETQPQCSTGIAEMREACITYKSRTGALTSESWQVFDKSSDLQFQFDGLLTQLVEQASIDKPESRQTSVDNDISELPPDSIGVLKVENQPFQQEVSPKHKETTKTCFKAMVSSTSGRVPHAQMTKSSVPLATRKLPSLDLELPSAPLERSNIDKVMTELNNIRFASTLIPNKTKFRMLFNIADIGGQSAFLEMLPSLTIGPALYLVFIKLSQGLTTRYPVIFKLRDGRGSRLCKNYTYTSEEVIFTSLTSIACFGSSDDEVERYVSMSGDTKQTSSYAVLVGTFKDAIETDAELDDIDDKLKQRLEVTDFFSDGLIHSKSFLRVDNYSADESEIENYRKLFEEILEKKFRKYEIPTRWLTLSICLKLLARREKRHEVSFDDCIQLGNELGMEENMVKVALQFLHKYIGLVMYFPNNVHLKEIVICDPQIVFSSISELIFDIYDPENMYITEAQHDNFVRTGCFSPKDINITSEKLFAKNLLSINTLVNLLFHLNIIAEVPASIIENQDSSSRCYFMPAVLQTAKLDSFSKQPNEEPLPEPLCIRFQTGYLPLGFVCALSANLISRSNFRLVPFVEDKQQVTYKNKMMFRFNGKFDVVMISGPKYCEFRVYRFSSSLEFWDKECCPYIKTIICEAADRVIQSLKHGSLYKPQKDLTYEIAFRCPNSKHRGKDIGHESLAKILYSNLTDGAFGNCPKEIQCVNPTCGARSELSNEMEIWFGKEVPVETPKLTKQPTISDDIIKIRVEGTKPLKYQWFKDDEEIGEDSDEFKGTSTAELTIQGPDSEVKGKYKCRVSNKYGEVLSQEIPYDSFAKLLKDKGLYSDEIIKLIDNGFVTLKDLLDLTREDLRSIGLKLGEIKRVERLITSLSNVPPNPGPTVFLGKLKTVLWDVRAKWKDLGIDLGLSMGTNEAIDSDHRGKSENCFTAVLAEWLKSEPQMDNLVKSLRGPVIDRADLADRLEESIDSGEIDWQQQ